MEVLSFQSLMQNFTWIDYKHFILVTKSFTTLITYVFWNFLKV